MKSEKIETIRKRFPKEWLLIEVTEKNKLTDTSIKGSLIAHNPDRDIIYQKMISVKSKRPLLVDYGQHRLRKDMAVIFSYVQTSA